MVLGAWSEPAKHASLAQRIARFILCSLLPIIAGCGGAQPAPEPVPPAPAPSSPVAATPTRTPAPTPDPGLSQTAAAATVAAAQAVTAEALLAAAEVVFRDDFVDNRNAWFVGAVNAVETDVIEDGVFKVLWSGAGASYELYELRELTSFIVEVDCQARGAGDGSCGLVFGAQEDGALYKFELFADYFRLYIEQPGGEPTLLSEGDPAGIMRPTGFNRLRVMRRGADVSLFINGMPIGAATDLTFLTGKVGLASNAYQQAPVEVWFDNFVIWELPR